MAKRPVLLVALLLLISSTALPATYAATKSGTTCKKIGQVQTVSGFTYKCVKSGKKAVWGAGIAVSRTKPTPVPSPVIPVDANKACRLPNGPAVRSDVAIGWPRIANRMKTVGVLNVKVVMVDFSDAPATRTPSEAFGLISGSADIFKEVSYGKLTYKFDPTLKWYRMGKPSTSYSFATFNGQKEYIQEAAQLAAKDVDFSNVDSLIVLANPDATALSFGPAFAPNAGQGITINGNYVGNGATSGHDLLSWGSIWLNHEISHTMGLVDLYSFTELNNNYDSIFRYTGDFSYMSFSSTKGNSPSPLAWERWLLGWIDDSQITCQTATSATTTLSPVERTGGMKAVIVPTGPTSAVVIESRRAEGLDKNMVKPGVLVYTVDTSVSSGLGPIKVQNIQSNDPRYTKSPLALGETVKVGTVSITVTASDSAGDTVSVSSGG